MIKISDFEKEIQQKIDRELVILPNPNNECAGVYHRGTYIGVTLPKAYILPTANAMHADIHGTPFRGVKEALPVIKERLLAYNEEKRKLTHEG